MWFAVEEVVVSRGDDERSPRLFTTSTIIRASLQRYIKTELSLKEL